ncbi:MAG: hypothetical protein ACYCV7_16100, partial [Acidimicrobiales bacterium]
MKFLRLPKTIGLAGILAGSALLAGGGGLGVAALASSTQAGALSAQLPAVGVREQNVNSAGRIRVALPKGGTGLSGNVSVNNFPKTQSVSGTVNVGNLPTNATGRLQTQNGRGITQMASGQYTVPSGNQATVTVLNTTGSGTFKSLNVMAYNQFYPNDGFSVAVFTDGVLAFDRNVAASCCWAQSSSVWSEATPNNFRSMYFNAPDGGFAFHHSLKVEIINVNGPSFPSFSGVYH